MDVERNLAPEQPALGFAAGPPPLWRLEDQIEKTAPGAKTREPRLFAAVKQLKPQHPIKFDGAAHVMGRERDGADAVDHGEKPI